MKYKIGEYSKMLGVTADTLRHYEKLGIIKPLKEDNSSYRLFGDLDCRNILRSRWFRSFDIPLNETIELTNEGSLEKVAEVFTKTSKDLALEIERLNGLLEKSNETLDICEKLHRNLHKCELDDFEGMYRICQTKENVLIKDSKTAKTVKQWMNLLPFTFFSFSLTGYKPTTHDHFDFDFGLAISIPDIHKLKIKLPSNIQCIQASKAVYMYVKLLEGEFISNATLDSMHDFASSKGYTFNGNVYGRILFSEKNENALYNYNEIIMPVNLTNDI
ncbi:MerR family transcriptional regulator [Alkalibacter mobilis]|uniref:MerR family transcriptional regulator n=1 Tax=Alkalibacter mobilis TaxID=2787712 RepID=UPI00189DCBC0|nr:MerR family transcriptional regulator [Alkalibacter mobilis]MBF7097425.1 MerR family transcriptional regulator [Alkalibacter mobilis]